jgi:hypothetical protein
VTWLLWKRRVLIRLVSSFPAFSSAFDFTAVVYSLQIEAVLAVKGMLIKIRWNSLLQLVYLVPRGLSFL